MLAASSQSSRAAAAARRSAARPTTMLPALVRQQGPRLVAAAAAASGGRGGRHRNLSAAAAAAKSWGEIAEEALQVGKDAANKVGEGLASIVKAATGAASGALDKRQQDADEERRLKREREEELRFPPQMFGGGLLGRVASGVLTQAARSLASTLEAQAREAADVRGAAEAALKRSPELAARLGGADFEVGPPMSQSSSSVSINGRAEKRVALVLPLVDGRTGRVLATARVDARPPAAGEGGGRGGDGGGVKVLEALPVDVVVTLPTGETLRVGGGGGGGRRAAEVSTAAGSGSATASRRRPGDNKGEVIDAEFKEL